MDVELELQLEQRLDDRVIVSLWLSPVAGQVALVEGAALQLVGPGGEELCPRHLLPLAGRISGELSMTVELRCQGCVPDSARVVATVWSGTAELQASCPADPSIDLRDHLRGSRLGLPPEDAVVLSPLTPADRARLEALLPWVGQPVRKPDVSGILEAPEPPPTARDLGRDFDLDPDTASWLEDLLDQDT